MPGASSTHDELFPLPVSIRALGMLTARAFNVWEPLFKWATATSPCREAAPFAVRDASWSAFRFEVPVSGWTRGIGRLCPALG